MTAPATLLAGVANAAKAKAAKAAQAKPAAGPRNSGTTPAQHRTTPEHTSQPWRECSTWYANSKHRALEPQEHWHDTGTTPDDARTWITSLGLKCRLQFLPALIPIRS